MKGPWTITVNKLPWSHEGTMSTNKKFTGVEQILTQGENQASGEWNFRYIWQNVYTENTMESEKNSEYWMYFPSTCAKNSKMLIIYSTNACHLYKTYGMSNIIILVMRIIILQAWITILSCLLQTSRAIESIKFTDRSIYLLMSQ